MVCRQYENENKDNTKPIWLLLRNNEAYLKENLMEIIKLLVIV